jgi:hypothetical protein
MLRQQRLMQSLIRVAAKLMTFLQTLQSQNYRERLPPRRNRRQHQDLRTLKTRIFLIANFASLQLALILPLATFQAV